MYSCGGVVIARLPALLVVASSSRMASRSRICAIAEPNAYG
jgi:hypothetical protein